VIAERSLVCPRRTVEVGPGRDGQIVSIGECPELELLVGRLVGAVCLDCVQTCLA
jgi:hypothetical protein